MTYDNSYYPPGWWLARLATVMDEQHWNDSTVMRMASAIDGRRRWGPDRLSKMRSRTSKGTIQMVTAISKAVRIPPPVVEALDPVEADALDRWVSSRRSPTTGEAVTSIETSYKTAVVMQRMAAAVQQKKDQTDPVSSKDEGSPRGLGHRRASGRRKTVTRTRP